MINYIKAHKLYIIAYLGMCVIFAVVFALYKLPLEAVVYPALLSLIFSISIFLFGYLIERKKITQLKEAQERKELLDTENLPLEAGLEREYGELVKLLVQEHVATVTGMNVKYQELSQYYTLWAHQIKTPIAAMRLKLTGMDSSFTRGISSDLQRIEQYVDMVMTYVRLGADATDYTFRQCSVDDIIKSNVKKFSSDFILKKLAFDFEESGLTIITDEKWLGFIIEQLLSNALKYTQKGKLSVCSRLVEGDGQRAVEISISDTGIGITPDNLPRIFEPGFTGLNGRMENNRASGIGLYLVKRICDNLGMSISAESVAGAGTTVTVLVPDKLRIHE